MQYFWKPRCKHCGVGPGSDGIRPRAESEPVRIRSGSEAIVGPRPEADDGDSNATAPFTMRHDFESAHGSSSKRFEAAGASRKAIPSDFRAALPDLLPGGLQPRLHFLRDESRTAPATRAAAIPL